MAEVLKTKRWGDFSNTLELDPYEVSIVIRAVRRTLAADVAEFEEKLEHLMAHSGEQDWRNDPDIQGEKEMLERAATLLRVLHRELE